MLRIKDTSTAVPGDWKFTDPDTKVRVAGGDYWDLVAAIGRHRRGNGLSPLEPKDIQDILCRALPPRADNCECYDPDSVPAPLPPNRAQIDQVISFIQFVGASVKKGAGFVSQEEAERRAAICARCPFNVKVKGCTGCRGLLRWVTAAIGKRKTAHDAQLRGCQICGCELRVAVHADLGAQQGAVPAKYLSEFPAYCWKASPVQTAR